MDVTLASTLELPCGAVLPNRISKAAMTEGLATPDGRPTPALERLYGIWSDGGAGMLLSGNIIVDRDHLERPGNVVIETEPDADMKANTELGEGAAGGQPLLGADQPWRPPDAEGRQPATDRLPTSWRCPVASSASPCR